MVAKKIWDTSRYPSDNHPRISICNEEWEKAKQGYWQLINMFYGSSSQLLFSASKMELVGRLFDSKISFPSGQHVFSVSTIEIVGRLFDSKISRIVILFFCFMLLN